MSYALGKESIVQERSIALRFRPAHVEEYASVLEFYHSLIDSMDGAQFAPGWKKGVYPTERFLKSAIESHQLFIGSLNEKIVGAMVMNHECAGGYETAHWKVVAGDDEVMVVHALGVSPDCQRQGIAGRMVSEAIGVCGELGVKAVRLDVLASNLPASKLYLSQGFQYIGTIRLYYEDTGLTDFLLYELAL